MDLKTQGRVLAVQHRRHRRLRHGDHRKRHNVQVHPHAAPRQVVCSRCLQYATSNRRSEVRVLPGALGFDAGDRLHVVQVAEFRLEAEPCAAFKVFGPQPADDGCGSGGVCHERSPMLNKRKPPLPRLLTCAVRRGWCGRLTYAESRLPCERRRRRVTDGRARPMPVRGAQTAATAAASGSVRGAARIRVLGSASRTPPPARRRV
jgi:hypothetical protein